MLSPFEDLSLSFSDMFTVTIFKGAALFVGVCFIGVFFFRFVLFCFAPAKMFRLLALCHENVGTKQIQSGGQCCWLERGEIPSSQGQIAWSFVIIRGFTVGG